MTIHPVEPYVFKNAVLAVVDDDFASHASTIALVPTTPAPDRIEWQGLTPDAKFSELADPGDPTWVLQVTLAQDWRVGEDTLANYLFDNRGLSKVWTIQPQRGLGLREFTVTATVVAPQIGGDVKTVQTSTVSMPCDGEPTPSVAA